MKQDKNIQKNTNENTPDKNEGGLGQFFLFFGGFVVLLVIISLVLNFFK